MNKNIQAEKNVIALELYLKEHPKAALAFSGGCDSAFLLAKAVEQNVQVQPYFVKSAFQPQFELEDAKRLCNQLGVSLRVLQTEPLAQKAIQQNGPLRCYYCKKSIFSALKAAAQSDGYTLLWDGTNASDSEVDRPGIKALQELSVQSPLRMARLTKQQIRKESEEMKLFTWNKPAYACLATRIPTGTFLTQKDLTRAENAETQLFKMGFSNFRVRVIKDAGKLQLPASQFEKAVLMHDEVVRQLKPWFNTILLDLEPRPEET